MDSDVEAILRRWTAIIDLAGQHTAKLSSAISDTRGLFAEIAALESWLDDIMAAHLSCELIVHNEVELGQFISNFQVSLRASSDASSVVFRLCSSHATGGFFLLFLFLLSNEWKCKNGCQVPYRGIARCIHANMHMHSLIYVHSNTSIILKCHDNRAPAVSCRD
jgi:hypothetical protein